MRIIVDKIPEQPKDCFFSLWNCEYGWLCKRFKYEPCYIGKNLECPYLKEQAGEET